MFSLATFYFVSGRIRLVYGKKSCAPERIEEQERAYVCNHCGKNFTQNGYLSKHQRKYCYWNPDSDGYGKYRPHACNFCGASYSKQSSLNSHLRFDCGRTHKCSDCGNTFLQINSLRKHKSFNCPARNLLTQNSKQNLKQ